MNQAIQIGSFSLPFNMLLLIVSVSLALFIGKRIASKADMMVENQLYGILFVGVLSARVAFVWQYHDAYFASPWGILDIRDGGWQPWAGLIGAGFAVLILTYRTPLSCKSVFADFAVFNIIWILGTIFITLPAARTIALPVFTASTVEGKPILLSQYRGKPTIINLWASWCPPCRREMPVFERAQTEYPEVDFVFLNQGESKENVLVFLDKNKLTLGNVLLDPNGEVAQMFNQQGLPATLFFDAKGNLVDSRLGELSYATLTHRIKTLSTNNQTNNR